MQHTQSAARILPVAQRPWVRPRVAVDAAVLLRVHRGAYVLEREWSDLFGDARLRTRAHAVQELTRVETGVYAYATAAALHGLPLYKVRSDRVDVICADVRGRRSAAGVRRHHVPVPDDDVVELEGLRATSLERTVYDVIRLESFETAVMVMDAALHAVAWDDIHNTYDSAADSEFRAGVRRRVIAHAGARGIRQARFVVEFADGRAGSPGESLSRLWCWQLGVPDPVLQYRVEFADGTYALLDLCWPGLGRWAEFDGLIKYTDPSLLAGRSSEDILRAQDARQQRVESATQWRCDRWGFEQMTSIDEFARFLGSISLR
jgi:hypothetical protein